MSEPEFELCSQLHICESINLDWINFEQSFILHYSYNGDLQVWRWSQLISFVKLPPVKENCWLVHWNFVEKHVCCYFVADSHRKWRLQLCLMGRWIWPTTTKFSWTHFRRYVHWFGSFRGWQYFCFWGNYFLCSINFFIKRLQSLGRLLSPKIPTFLPVWLIFLYKPACLHLVSCRWNVAV